jgi:hypothetical protein
MVDKGGQVNKPWWKDPMEEIAGKLRRPRYS